MEIKTKFAIDDEVYFLLDNRVHMGTISEIHTQTKEDFKAALNSGYMEVQTVIFYKLNKQSNRKDGRFYENQLYASKDEIARAVVEGTLDV